MYVCRFIRNCYLSWIYKREQMVLVIQSFFHIIKAKRLLYFKKGWVNYPTMFYNAAVAIQKIMRAYLARKFYEAKFKEFLFRRLNICTYIRAYIHTYIYIIHHTNTCRSIHATYITYIH